MRFLLDMGIGPRVADWLREEGHDAVHLRDQGLQRLPDDEIFAKAADEDRVIITTDLDFPELVALSRDSVVSVIVFRMAYHATERINDRLAAVLEASAQALENGAIVVVEDSRHRVRLLPIGRDG